MTIRNYYTLHYTDFENETEHTNRNKRVLIITTFWNKWHHYIHARRTTKTMLHNFKRKDHKKGHNFQKHDYVCGKKS